MSERDLIIEKIAQERKAFINDGLMNECETSLQTLKAQMMDLKHKINISDEFQANSDTTKELFNRRGSDKPSDFGNISGIVPSDENKQQRDKDREQQQQAQYNSQGPVTSEHLTQLIEENYRLESQLKQARLQLDARSKEVEIQQSQLNSLSHQVIVSQPSQLCLDSREKSRQKSQFFEKENAQLLIKVANLEHENAMLKSAPQRQDIESHRMNEANRNVHKLELEKLELKEDNELMRQRIAELEHCYSEIKGQLDSNIGQYEQLLNKAKENDDDKTKYASHAKKLQDNLKNMNNHYQCHVKKIQQLEKDNSTLKQRLDKTEDEKRSYMEKWLRQSKKAKADESTKATIKCFEQELEEKNQELEDFREKFVATSTELLVIRESERAYKKVIDEKTAELTQYREKVEQDQKDKETILNQNLELISKIEKLQGELQSHNKKTENSYKQMEESSKLQHSNQMLSRATKRLEIENSELKKQIVTAKKEADGATKKNSQIDIAYQKTKNDLEYTKTKWDLLLKEYEKLQTDYSKLQLDYQAESEINAMNQGSIFSEQLVQNGEEIGLVYDIQKDCNLRDLADSIDKVREINVQLYEELAKGLEGYVTNIKQSFTNDKLVIKYNKLLVKYFRVQDQIKEFEKKAQEVGLGGFLNQSSRTVSSTAQGNLQSSSAIKQRDGLQQPDFGGNHYLQQQREEYKEGVSINDIKSEPMQNSLPKERKVMGQMPIENNQLLPEGNEMITFNAAIVSTPNIVTDSTQNAYSSQKSPTPTKNSLRQQIAQKIGQISTEKKAFDLVSKPKSIEEYSSLQSHKHIKPMNDKIPLSPLQTPGSKGFSSASKSQKQFKVLHLQRGRKKGISTKDTYQSHNENTTPERSASREMSASNYRSSGHKNPFYLANPDSKRGVSSSGKSLGKASNRSYADLYSAKKEQAAVAQQRGFEHNASASNLLNVNRQILLSGQECQIE